MSVEVAFLLFLVPAHLWRLLFVGKSLRGLMSCGKPHPPNHLSAGADTWIARRLKPTSKPLSIPVLAALTLPSFATYYYIAGRVLTLQPYSYCDYGSETPNFIWYAPCELDIPLALATVLWIDLLFVFALFFPIFVIAAAIDAARRG